MGNLENKAGNPLAQAYHTTREYVSPLRKLAISAFLAANLMACETVAQGNDGASRGNTITTYSTTTPTTKAGTQFDTHSRLTIAFPEGMDCPLIGSFYGTSPSLRGLQRYSNHAGIDIARPVGTPVLAVADGRVSIVRNNHEQGLDVWIEHYNLGLKSDTLMDFVKSQYGHVQNPTVKVGQRVKRGDVIAYVGGHIEGPHLHLAMNTGNTIATFINPVLVYAGVLDDKSLTSKVANIAHFDKDAVNDEVPSKKVTVSWPFPCTNK